MYQQGVAELLPTCYERDLTRHGSNDSGKPHDVKQNEPFGQPVPKAIETPTDVLQRPLPVTSLVHDKESFPDGRL